MPTAAVCIPTYNQAQYLELAVASALSQSYPICEVWIANDASDDATKDVLMRLSARDSRVKWFSNPERLGIGMNVDTVLRKPKTDFVVRLDSDDRLSECYIEEMIRLFEKYPEAGIFHCNTREVDQDGIQVRLRWRAGSDHFQPAEAVLKEAPFRFGITANICGFRRSMLEELDFTRGRPDYLEDYDLWVRAAAAGYGNVFSSKVLADYRVWIDAKGTRVKRKRTELEGLIRLFDEILVPVYRDRGWPVEMVTKGRRKHAMRQVSYLAEVKLADGESRDIGLLLKKLSDDSPIINALTAMGRSRFRGILLLLKTVRVGLWRAKIFARQMLGSPSRG